MLLVLFSFLVCSAGIKSSEYKIDDKRYYSGSHYSYNCYHSVCIAVKDVQRISVDIRSSLSIRTGFTESLLAWINDFVKEI